jgi:hypothetical protein
MPKLRSVVTVLDIGSSASIAWRACSKSRKVEASLRARGSRDEQPLSTAIVRQLLIANR